MGQITLKPNWMQRLNSGYPTTTVEQVSTATVSIAAGNMDTVRMHFAKDTTGTGQRVTAAKLRWYMSANGPAELRLTLHPQNNIHDSHAVQMSLGTGDIGARWWESAIDTSLAAQAFETSIAARFAINSAWQGATGIFWSHLSGQAPQLVLTTENITFTPQNLAPSGESINKGFVHRFSWSASNGGGLILGNPSVKRFTVFYRGKGEATWKKAETTAYYVDINTGDIENDEAMEWYVSALSDSGMTGTSSIASVQFKSTSVRLSDLFPSSDAPTYKGFDAEFSWKATYTIPEGESGSLKQRSAILRWRKKSQADVTEYTISGEAEKFTLGGDVLPPGDLEWQVEATNTSGSSATSNWTSFENIELAITATDMFPGADGRIIRNLATVFGWAVVVEEGDAPGPIVQQSAILRWKDTGTETVHEITGIGSETSCSVPARTFSSESIDWQVEITANTGTSYTSEWITVPVGDVKSDPTCVSPVGKVMDDNAGITFVWLHVIATGTEQSAWELSYSANAGAQYTVFAQGDGSDNECAVAANVLPQGELLWRVRTRNADDEWGNYSAAATLIIRRAANKPAIVFADTLPRPTLRWNSDEQQAYRVTIDDFDTGWIFGTEKTFRYPDLLADGQHLATVSIMTMFGLIASADITLHTKNKPGENIEVLVHERPLSVTLSWQTEGVYAAYYILRDGVPIARTTDVEFTDRMASGPHAYVIRGFTADGYYTDSDPAVGVTYIPFAVISELGTNEWVLLKLKSGGMPTNTQNVSYQDEYVHYAGQAKPGRNASPFYDVVHTFGYSFKRLDQVEKLKKLQNKTVVYRNRRGQVIVGGMGQLTVNLQRIYDLTFTVTEIEFEERVEYED